MKTLFTLATPQNRLEKDTQSNHMAETLTAIILTFNEAMHIERCIGAVRGVAQRVFVIDSGSTDGTVDIARANGAEVLQNPWKNYAIQFNWALDNAKIDTDWVLRIDADEVLDPALQTTISDFLTAPPSAANAAILRRQIVFLGRPIRHGFFYPLHNLRMWRNGQGRVETRWMDEHVKVQNEVSVVLNGTLVDHNLNDLGWWTAKHNGYAMREVYDIIDTRRGGDAADLSGLSLGARAKRFAKNRLYAYLPRPIRPALYFIYRYVFGAGFLDGREGFYFHLLQSFWYRTLVDAKLLELEMRAHEKNISPYDLLVSEGILLKK